MIDYKEPMGNFNLYFSDVETFRTFLQIVNCLKYEGGVLELETDKLNDSTSNLREAVIKAAAQAAKENE